jgi:hypothetical protein
VKAKNPYETEMPAGKHEKHTRREWTANPASAPLWAKSGDKIVCGASNWDGCEPCERYAREEYIPEYNAYWEERRNAEAKQEAEEAALKAQEEAAAAAELEDLVKRYQGGATSS